MKTCPKCGGVAPSISPVKNAKDDSELYGCTACGHAFGKDGVAFVSNPQQLQDVFRGATFADQKVTEIFSGEKLNPAMRALFQAKLLEYGLQMWFDGCKQGLLLGATQAHHEAQRQKS